MTRSEFTSWAQAQGWRPEKTGSCHIRWTHASGAIVFSAWTPRSERAWVHTRLKMARALAGRPMARGVEGR